MNKKTSLQNGVTRVKLSDLKQYIKKDNLWLPTDYIDKNIKNLIEAYSKNNNLNLLLDEDNNDFLKGYISPDNFICGKRINTLPNGQKLARGGFSIFAKNLKFNKTKKSQWDVCYQNSSGLKTYLYSEEKIEHEKKRKTSIVNSFIREYPQIIEKLEKDIKKNKKIEYLALYILIKTYIRVGNLEYFKHLGHKGLTTLQKKDIKIKNNTVIFQFIGKDGIEQKIEKQFDEYIITQLKQLLEKKQNNDFVFTDKNNFPIHSQIFSKLLYSYTKKHFYPHIIRSFYADSEIRAFLKTHKNPTPKNKVINKFKEIALNLGHKKYDKKNQKWIADYKVTQDNYIRPEYVEKMKKLYA